MQDIQDLTGASILCIAIWVWQLGGSGMANYHGVLGKFNNKGWGSRYFTEGFCKIERRQGMFRPLARGLVSQS